MNTVDVKWEGAKEKKNLSLFNYNKVKEFVEKIFSLLNYENVEISIIFCDNAYIKDLNKGYRGLDEETDVLSFSQREGEFTPILEHEEDGAPGAAIPLGDIVISEEMCKTNADSYSTSPEMEAKRLLVHGVLHLHGMTHSNAEEHETMISYQEDILEALNEVKLL